MESEGQRPSEVEARLSQLEARLNAVDANTLTALGSNTVVEALVKRASDDLLESRFLKNAQRSLLVLAGAGLVVWAGGTVYGEYKIISIQERATQAEQKITASETAVSARSAEVLRQSIAFQETIDERVRGITTDAEERIGNAVTDVEGKVEPANGRIGAAAKMVEDTVGPAQERINQAAASVEGAVDPAAKRIEAAAGQVETASKGAIESIGKEQRTALDKLKLPSIDELDTVRQQIEALQTAGGQLNLKSIRSFVNLQVTAVGIFSVLAFGISVATWFRAARRGGG